MRSRLAACLLALLLLSPAHGAFADPPASEPALEQGLARGCVAAAWRASGLGEDDARIDSMIVRASTSALLPETSMRAMQLWSDATHTTTLAASDSTTLYDALGTHVVLEVRLTWKLDRLVYAGEEAALERIRLERLQDARRPLRVGEGAGRRRRSGAGVPRVARSPPSRPRGPRDARRADGRLVLGAGRLSLTGVGRAVISVALPLPCSAKRATSLPTSNGASWR